MARFLLIIGVVASGLVGVVAALMLFHGSLELFPNGEQQEKARLGWAFVLAGSTGAVLVQWRLLRAVRR